jgi:hypothetical protein
VAIADGLRLFDSSCGLSCIHSKLLADFPSQELEVASFASVILIGCADDLVVSDPGREHSGGSVRGARLVYALAKKFAEGPGA